MTVKDLMEYNGNYCVRCGALYQKGVETLRVFSIDHIHEKVDGGTNDRSNMQVLCLPCHHTKTKMSSIRRNQLGRKITLQEALELNAKFLKNEFEFQKIMVNNKRHKLVVFL